MASGKHEKSITPLREVFQNNKPRWIPWYADLSWWHEATQRQGELPPEFQGAKGLVYLHRYLDCGFYLPLVNAAQRKFDCPVDQERSSELIVTTYKTPHGELHEVFRYLESSASWHYEQRFLQKSEQLPAVRYLLESQFYEANAQEVEEKKQLYEPVGVVILELPRSPLGRMFMEFAGIETSVNLFLEEPEQFSALLQLFWEKDQQAREIIYQAPAEFAMLPDNISGELYSPQLFDSFCREFYQQLSAELREHKKFSLVHIDGTLRTILPRVSQCGFDCLEALTPAPVGDLEPEQLRPQTNPEVILWGGLPGALFSGHHTITEFEDYVRHYLDVMLSQGRFVLGIGDQLPPDAQLEKMLVVRQLVDEYSPRLNK